MIEDEQNQAIAERQIELELQSEFEKIDTYGQLEKEVKKNLDVLYNQYITQILNRTEYQQLQEFLNSQNKTDVFKDLYFGKVLGSNITDASADE